METEHFIIEAEHFKIEAGNVEIETEHFKMKAAHLKIEALRLNLNAQSARSSRGSCETGKQANHGSLLHIQRRAQVGSREQRGATTKRKRTCPPEGSTAHQAARPAWSAKATKCTNRLARMCREAWAECRQIAERQEMAWAG